MVSSAANFRTVGAPSEAAEVLPVATEVQITEDSIEQSLNEQYSETALVLRKSVALEKITDNETYISICNKVTEAQSNIKAIEAQIEPFRVKRRSALDRIFDIKNKLLEPFLDVKARGSKLIAVYQYEQEEKRKILEDAQRQQQLQKQGEQNQSEAKTLWDEGREAEAVALLDSAPVVAPVAVPRDVPKVAGISKAKEKYTAEVENFSDLVKAVAEGKVPILAICPDQKWLDKQADQMKTLLNYPGVKVQKTVGLAGVRGR